MATPRLVALDLPGGPAFVAALQRVWDAGDVAFPLDQRLPGPARDELLRVMGVDAVRTAQGLAELDVSHDLPSLVDGDALVVATSGSTGTPKGAVLTHDAVRASALATSQRLEVTTADQWLACLPLSHVGGLSVVTRALATGARLTVLPGFDPDVVQRSDATLVSLVTTALARIDPARFRRIVVGGSAMPPDLPANVVRTYGLTETGSGVVYDGVPLDGVEVRIDGDGEIHLRGPMLLRCYRDGTTPLVDGWLATGDLGSWGPDGRLRVAGRRGDLIITGGENVWPEAVESRLRDHPAVADVAVAGIPDAEWGQIVTAFVVARPDTSPTLDSLRDHVKAAMPAFAAPKRLVLVTAIPRTNLGKPRRADLIARSSEC